MTHSLYPLRVILLSNEPMPDATTRRWALVPRVSRFSCHGKAESLKQSHNNHPSPAYFGRNTMSSYRKPSRRDFIKLTITGAALTGLPPTLLHSRRAVPKATVQQAHQTSLSTLPNGVAAGDVTQTSAVLWTHSTSLGTVSFDYSASPAFAVILGTRVATVDDPTLPVKVPLDDLQPDTEYFYRVTDSAGSQLTGRFVTPAADGVRRGLHFGVTGDWRGELRPYVALANVAERNLDFFMLHGDTIYADVPSIDFPSRDVRTLADYRIKHNEVYSTRFDLNYWADIRASTSVYVVDDDHEVVDDFAGGAPPSTDSRFDNSAPTINQTQLFRNGMQALLEYNPLRDEFYAGTNDPRVDGVVKLYRCVTFGSDASIFVLDARAFRDQSEPQISPLQAINPIAVRHALASMFEPGRTMLGRPQLELFKRDLLAAHNAGITWKFVMIPEPVQNMGWFGGVDRWEGYAPERTEVLKFIEDNNIRNVVFVSADVHATFINSLTYQTEVDGEHIPTHAFEISTGSVASYPPPGQIIMERAGSVGLLSDEDFAAYRQMSLPEKDARLEDLFNLLVLGLQGFSQLGLEDSLINWERISGGWVVGHSFGWSEFEIEPDTQKLIITTYGVPAYDFAQTRDDPGTILSYTPEVYSKLVITPQPPA